MCESVFLGCWKLVKNDNDNFDKYMEGIGVSMITRKAAGTLKPDVIISCNDGVWTVRTESTFKKSEFSFKLGEEFDEETPDGRKTKTIVTLENGVLCQTQKWDDKETKITREVKDSELIATCIFEDVKCVRVYEKK
ncbi:fatty acid-binding protein, adipocyte-like [Bombina bombina]|uniref:fatty acid-binding protein, adipocyte-like n=1 Tax=Bombina bombina TaxID=8345 RepID=UPI00235AD639|nr:fatty acid-binding protein, adipocyte-like [Bombina bombina]